MTEINQKIIDMIEKSASANEICEATGLSNRQLYYRQNMMKSKGYSFSKKFFYNGDIVYKLNKELVTEKNHEIALFTSKKDNQFRAVFISDLHLSNKGDRVDLLNAVYNFCIKEGINIIINGGDLVDGLLGHADFKKKKNIEEQLEYALNVYPFDKSILNFICLGNHDHNILENTGQNIENILEAKRHDIVSLGYGLGVLKIKNDEIIIRHPKTPHIINKGAFTTGLILNGHGHRAQTSINGNLVNFNLTTLSDMNIGKYDSLPGFIKATIDFKNGIFSSGIFENFVFADKLYKVNESQYELFKGKNLNEQLIKYEEERIGNKQEKEKVKTLKKEESRISQIDKFKRRYGK